MEPWFQIILEHPEKPEVILDRINTIQPGSISQSQQKESNFIRPEVVPNDRKWLKVLKDTKYIFYISNLVMTTVKVQRI